MQNYRPLLLIAGAILLFFLILTLFTKIVGPIPFAVNSVVTNKSDSFLVTGVGEASAPPDTAMVTLGVQTQGATVEAAQQSLNTSINAVSEAVKAQGVEASDIQTTNYSINPTYDFNAGTQRITGYTASSNLQVEVKDISKINPVIDAATQAGANQVGGVTFTIDDPTKLENEAREEAIAEAKERANAASAAAGFKLGPMINYNENISTPGEPNPVPLSAGGRVDMATNKTEVKPGSNVVRVEVFLNYQIY